MRSQEAGLGIHIELMLLRLTSLATRSSSTKPPDPACSTRQPARRVPRRLASRLTATPERARLHNNFPAPDISYDSGRKTDHHPVYYRRSEIDKRPESGRSRRTISWSERLKSRRFHVALVGVLLTALVLPNCAPDGRQQDSEEAGEVSLHEKPSELERQFNREDGSAWVTILDPEKSAVGYTLLLYKRRLPYLIDAQGRTVHAWRNVRVSLERAWSRTGA